MTIKPLNNYKSTGFVDCMTAKIICASYYSSVMGELEVLFKKKNLECGMLSWFWYNITCCYNLLLVVFYDVIWNENFHTYPGKIHQNVTPTASCKYFNAADELYQIITMGW